MFDSTTAGDAPNGADLYADYLDIPSSHDPRATVHICRDGNANAGHVLDVGEGVPNSQAPGWARNRRASSVEPTVYTNYANWGACRAEFDRQGVPHPQWWIAWYTTDQSIVARCFAEGAVAVQWANPPISGGHFDESAVADHWPGVDSGGTDEDMAQINLLGRGIVQALHQIAFGTPAPQSDLDNVQANALDPNNAGGWEWAIDNYIGAIAQAGGVLHVTPSSPSGHTHSFSGTVSGTTAIS